MATSREEKPDIESSAKVTSEFLLLRPVKAETLKPETPKIYQIQVIIENEFGFFLVCDFWMDFDLFCFWVNPMQLRKHRIKWNPFSFPKLN